MALLETACIRNSEAAGFTIKKCIEREGKISYDGGLGHSINVLKLDTSLTMLKIQTNTSGHIHAELS